MTFDFNVPLISNTIGSKVGFETSVKVPGKKRTLTTLPGPTKDFIIVTISNHSVNGKVILTLYDANGALVKTQNAITTETIRMDVEKIPVGVYFLHAQIGKERGAIMIVKN